jgi:cathepsin D
MHLSSCLVLVAGISGVHAFYPWELRLRAELSADKTIERRFMPWDLIEPKSEDSSTGKSDSSDSSDSKPFTLDVKKIPVRRDNGYKIVEAYMPSVENSAQLNQDGTDYSYFSPVQIGSEKQLIWMQVDTGAPSTWVYDSQCNKPVCQNHRTFNTSKSTSYEKDSSSGFSIFYGSGNIDGKLGKDTISIAGLEVSQTFGQANNASERFESYPFDGILGLGRSNTNGWKLPSFMDVVADAKLLKSNLVGFSLSRAANDAKDGQINFGGVDTTKFDGTISYTPTNSEVWSIPVDDAYVNGQKCNFSGKSATLDTGTTYILIPPEDAKTLFSLVPDSSQQPDNPNNYLVPCNSNATIEFEFSGVKYNISPKDYIGSKEPDGSDHCISTIVSYAHNGETWLVGDVFLKNVYTVFDFENGQIGLGALASSSAEAQNATLESTSNSSSPSPSSVPAEGNGTFTAPPVTKTVASAAESTSSSAVSAASHFTRGISWSMLTVIIGAFAI